jgi:hypothetical protein
MELAAIGGVKSEKTGSAHDSERLPLALDEDRFTTPARLKKVG